MNGYWHELVSAEDTASGVLAIGIAVSNVQSPVRSISIHLYSGSRSTYQSPCPVARSIIRCALKRLESGRECWIPGVENQHQHVASLHTIPLTVSRPTPTAHHAVYTYLTYSTAKLTGIIRGTSGGVMTCWVAL